MTKLNEGGLLYILLVCQRDRQMSCAPKVNVGTEFPDAGNICGAISPLFVVILQILHRKSMYEKAVDVSWSLKCLYFKEGSSRTEVFCCGAHAFVFLPFLQLGFGLEVTRKKRVIPYIYLNSPLNDFLAVPLFFFFTRLTH